jgi:hypothetical protein
MIWATTITGLAAATMLTFELVGVVVSRAFAS